MKIVKLIFRSLLRLLSLFFASFIFVYNITELTFDVTIAVSFWTTVAFFLIPSIEEIKEVFK